MTDNKDLIAEARKLALIDRESREPVVRALLVLADALEAAEQRLSNQAKTILDYQRVTDTRFAGEIIPKSMSDERAEVGIGSQ